MKLQIGDYVRYKDSDRHVYRVYAIYPNGYVSLGLRDYPDTEQDYQIKKSKLLKLYK
jgi:hypothetical protein